MQEQERISSHILRETVSLCDYDESHLDFRVLSKHIIGFSTCQYEVPTSGAHAESIPFMICIGNCTRRDVHDDGGST